ncbi:MAG: AMP-binding protein [Thermodesulfobacteriota bacterium]
MARFNIKNFLRKTLGFLNVGSMFSFLAASPFRKHRVFFVFEDRAYTFADTSRIARQYAALFHFKKAEAVRNGRLKPEDPMAVGIYQENTPEFIFAFMGAAMSGSVLFGLNTGFRGDTLVKIINQANISLLIADTTTIREISRVMPDIKSLSITDVLLVGAQNGAAPPEVTPIETALLKTTEPEAGIKKRGIDIFGPLIVIYTSGTTGLPKGVPCSHAKCIGAAFVTRKRIGLRADDRGYICMPLFHSNSILLGIMPLMLVGGSFLLKRKFSASSFEGDILTHGVSYMNYVGQPIHYILTALEKKYGNPAAIVSALSRNPRNRFRIAHGNGAPPVDREKMIRYLGMEHIFELYGSTEAPITTVVQPGDPPESVGQLTSSDIVILNEQDCICPPGVPDAKGNLTNYQEAVGEIARKMEPDNVFFDGYFQNRAATDKKFRDGFYRSGDLGHVRMVNGKRYLYFNGRTDDWIRKDGENFSAENVALHALQLPDVMQVAAFGVPCPVADEKVMVALQLADNRDFDPRMVFDWFMERQTNGGLDPKWMPDYIRVLEDLPTTQTHKILVRPLKQQHFHVERYPDMQVYYRKRGDTTYYPLTPEAFQEIKKEFQQTGRLHLLEQQ